MWMAEPSLTRYFDFSQCTGPSNLTWIDRRIQKLPARVLLFTGHSYYREIKAKIIRFASSGIECGFPESWGLNPSNLSKRIFWLASQENRKSMETGFLPDQIFGRVASA